MLIRGTFFFFFFFLEKRRAGERDECIIKGKREGRTVLCSVTVLLSLASSSFSLSSLALRPSFLFLVYKVSQKAPSCICAHKNQMYMATLSRKPPLLSNFKKFQWNQCLLLGHPVLHPSTAPTTHTETAPPLPRL